jgi:hypothetical protein
MQSEDPKVTILKRELWILTVHRSLRPCVKDNARMWEIMAELYELTNDPMYNLKPQQIWKKN